MKKTIIALSIATVLTSTPGMAAQQATNIGYGPVGGEHSVFSTVSNPVNNQSALNGSDFGIGAAATFSGEYSGFENVFTNFENDIQAKVSDFSLTQADADAFIDKHKNGLISVSADTVIPLLVKTEKYGNISVELQKSRGISMTAFEHNQLNNNPLVPAEVQLGVQGTYVEKNELSVGFARTMTSVDLDDTFGSDAKLSYGVKARMVQIGGNTYAYNFNRNLSSLNDVEQEIEDAVNVLDDSVSTDSSVTVDLGFRVSTPNWNVGLTGKNLVAVETDLEVKHDAQATSDMSDSYEAKVKMEPYGIIDAAYHTEDKNWKISAYAETNEHQVYTGAKEQNIGVHASYATDNAWIPDVRLGADKNLAGSELTKYSIGLTMGIASLDISASDFSYDGENQEDFAGQIAFSLEAEF